MVLCVTPFSIPGSYYDTVVGIPATTFDGLGDRCLSG